MKKLRQKIIDSVYLAIQFGLPVITSALFLYWIIQTYLYLVSGAVPESEYQKLIEFGLYGLGLWLFGGFIIFVTIVIAALTWFIVYRLTIVLNKKLKLGL